MKLTRVGVNLAKRVLRVHGVDRGERAVWCQWLKRDRSGAHLSGWPVEFATFWSFSRQTSRT